MICGTRIQTERLQVSRRWQQVLTSTPVRLAAVRATIGPAALESIHLETSNPTRDPLDALFKRRLRVESATPIFRLRLPGASNASWHAEGVQAVGYSNGICAWLNGSNQGEILVLFHLVSQTQTTLTTENRETLTEIRLSNMLVAAVARGGYCHVWNLETHDHKSFRIPSLKYRHFLVNGFNVAFSFETEDVDRSSNDARFDENVIHWNFNEGCARKTPVENNIVLLTLHPSEVQFTVTQLRASNTEEDADGSTMSFLRGTSDPVYAAKYHLHTQKFALNTSNDFHCTCSREQNLPLHDMPGYQWFYRRWHCHEIHRGESAAVLLAQGDLFTARSEHLRGVDQGKIYFSSGLANDVEINTLRHETGISTITCVDQDILYAVSNSPLNLHVLTPKTSHASTVVRSWHEIGNRGDRTDLWECKWISGDNRFVVFSYDHNREIVAWVLDETVTKESSSEPE